MEIGEYIKAGWGSYAELIQMSIRDILEIRIGIESKAQEEKLQSALGS